MFDEYLEKPVTEDSLSKKLVKKLKKQKFVFEPKSFIGELVAQLQLPLIEEM